MIEKQDPIFLVWRETQRERPAAELWFGDKTDNMKPITNLLAKHPLTPEECKRLRAGILGLGDLVKLYPAPK